MQDHAYSVRWSNIKAFPIRASEQVTTILDIEDTFDWYCKSRSPFDVIVDTRETTGDDSSPTSAAPTSSTTATSTFHPIRETIEDCSSPTTNTTSMGTSKRKPALQSTREPVASVWKWKPCEKENDLDRAIAQNIQEPSEHCDTEDESLCDDSADEELVWSSSHQNWEEKFQRLVDYKEKHKTTAVKRGDNHDAGLAVWVRRQRYKRSKDQLPQYYVDRLNSIGFVWQIRRPWMEMYHRLLSYKDQHEGSTLVPQKSQDYRALGNWVSTQRRRFHQDKLSSERVTLLESIGFQWKLHEHIPWMEMYRRLKSYKQHHNDTCVPKHYPDDPKLANWVVNQRLFCKDADRVALLDSIGFEWDTPNQWDIMYRRLLAYQTKHGTTRVPANYKDDPRLGKWVKKQRERCHRQDRVDRLNSIGFEWNARVDRWMELYERLVLYKKNHGHTCVPFRYKADPQLGKWVQRQRHGCKERYRVGLLNEIDFEWNWKSSEKRNRSWSILYQRLVAYQKQHGTTLVPHSYEPDPQLGHWVLKQRQTCKEKDRIDRLDAIGFVWNAKGVTVPNNRSRLSRLPTGDGSINR